MFGHCEAEVVPYQVINPGTGQESMESMRRRMDPARNFMISTKPLGADSTISDVIRYYTWLGKHCAQFTDWEMQHYIIEPLIYEAQTGQVSPVVPPCYEGM